MKRANIFILFVLLLFINNIAISQEFLIKLKDYSKDEIKTIIKDSIWLGKEAWKSADINDLDEAKRVEFIIIPLVRLKNTVPEGKYRETIVNHLEFVKDWISAFVIKDDSLIAHIYAMQSNLPPTIFIYDPVEGLFAAPRGVTSYEIVVDSLTGESQYEWIYNNIEGNKYWYLSSFSNMGRNNIRFLEFPRSFYNLIKNKI